VYDCVWAYLPFQVSYVPGYCGVNIGELVDRKFLFFISLHCHYSWYKQIQKKQGVAKNYMDLSLKTEKNISMRNNNQ